MRFFARQRSTRVVLEIQLSRREIAVRRRIATDAVSTKPFHLTYGARLWFVDWLRRRDGESGAGCASIRFLCVQNCASVCIRPPSCRGRSSTATRLKPLIAVHLARRAGQRQGRWPFDQITSHFCRLVVPGHLTSIGIAGYSE